MRPKELVKAFVEAFNRADVEALTNFYRETAINHQEGKIVFQRGYWDKLSFLKQHSLPLPEM